MVQFLDRFNRNITRCTKNMRKLFSQRSQHAGFKVTAPAAGLDDGPLRRLLEFVVEPGEVTSESRGEELATLGTGAIVAFPPPALEIRSFVVTSGFVVESRVHPIVKSDRPAKTNLFP